MSNHQTHLDAAKQVCLTALRHINHGCVVSVKQHSGSVVDEPGEPARIILTLELEALDLPAANNQHRDDKFDSLAGIALEEAKRHAMADLFGKGGSVEQQIDAHFGVPTVRGVPFVHGIMEEVTRRGVDLEAKFGRGSRLATGEESGGESLHAVKDAEGKDRMVMASLESGPVVKVPALTREALTTIVYSAGLGLTTSRLDTMIESIMLAQEAALR